MKKIGLYVKFEKAAHDKADVLEKWLRDRKIEVVRQETFQPQMTEGIHRHVNAPEDLFCVFVLGGDGTFLSASRWIGDAGTPIIGVKFGEIGFLAEITEETLFDAAERVIEGKFVIEPRMRLNVRILRGEAVYAEETVLNDVIINKGALARLANIRTFINDNYLTTYRSDGLIVATPTGSTAYSLAAGGPVVHPAVEGIVITPICPFTLTNRPLIVPNTVVIKIHFDEKARDMVVTFDGQEGLEILPTDIIHIEKSRSPLHIIKFPEQNYFDILKAKLRWSGGRV